MRDGYVPKPKRLSEFVALLLNEPLVCNRVVDAVGELKFEPKCAAYGSLRGILGKKAMEGGVKKKIDLHLATLPSFGTVWEY